MIRQRVLGFWCMRILSGFFRYAVMDSSKVKGVGNGARLMGFVWLCGRVGFGRSSIDVLGSSLEEIKGYDICSVGLFDERRGVFGR